MNVILGYNRQNKFNVLAMELCRKYHIQAMTENEQLWKIQPITY